MPTLSSLQPVLPVLAALLGGALALLARPRQQTGTTALWILWAGVAGGTVASAGMSAEWLNMGTGGIAISGLGGLAGAALMSTALVAVPGPARWRGAGGVRSWERHHGWRRPDPVAATRAWASRHAGAVRSNALGVALGLTASVVAVGLALAGLGWIGVLLLLLLGRRRSRRARLVAGHRRPHRRPAARPRR